MRMDRKVDWPGMQEAKDQRANRKIGKFKERKFDREKTHFACLEEVMSNDSILVVLVLEGNQLQEKGVGEMSFIMCLFHLTQTEEYCE